MDKEVVTKQKELMVGTVGGVLRAKVELMVSRAVPVSVSDWVQN